MISTKSYPEMYHTSKWLRHTRTNVDLLDYYPHNKLTLAHITNQNEQSHHAYANFLMPFGSIYCAFWKRSSKLVNLYHHTYYSTRFHQKLPVAPYILFYKISSKKTSSFIIGSKDPYLHIIIDGSQALSSAPWIPLCESSTFYP